MDRRVKGLSRLRASEGLRSLVRETRVGVDDLIAPLFVHHEAGWRQAIGSMPGQYQLGVEEAAEQARQWQELGLRAVLLFGLPAMKDAEGSASWDDEGGVIQRALRAIRQAAPEMVCITDVCFCEYTDHGHCGVLTERGGKRVLDHAATRANLAKQALSHARAGADMVAPSGMIDGQVSVIRAALDEAGQCGVGIMAYSAKYASGFYGPFREAAEGAPQFGDRRSYQMDPANGAEAMREVSVDVEEGADIVMVKPAMAYMDVIYRVKQAYGLPTAAYNVSGEYAMVKAAAQAGWLDERTTVLEMLTGFKRAGADMIITYHAADAARWLRQ